MSRTIAKQIAALLDCDGIEHVPTNMRWADELLEEYGSNEDPIIYRGKDTTIRDLAYGLEGSITDNPAIVRISFYGDIDGKCKLRRGTVLSMLLDRIKLRRGRDKAWRPEKNICHACGQEIK